MRASISALVLGSLASVGIAQSHLEWELPVLPPATPGFEACESGEPPSCAVACSARGGRARMKGAGDPPGADDLRR
ncbi:MAG: hypothetical protein CMJ84_03110 [Planctomycetes bacterium]|jgi:hypothetical protein|nr:hypothetical protein [Planctomycetota bacterium]